MRLPARDPSSSGAPRRARVAQAASAGAGLGALLSVIGNAASPGIVVYSVGTSAACVAALAGGRRTTQPEWLAVRLLIAGNILLLILTSADLLGPVGIAIAALIAVALVIAAWWLAHVS